MTHQFRKASVIIVIETESPSFDYLTLQSWDTTDSIVISPTFCTAHIPPEPQSLLKSVSEDVKI